MLGFCAAQKRFISALTILRMDVKSWHIALAGTIAQFLVNLSFSGMPQSLNALDVKILPWAGLIFSALFYFDRHQKFILENTIVGAFFTFF